jgi:hypothetical protein
MLGFLCHLTNQASTLKVAKCCPTVVFKEVFYRESSLGVDFTKVGRKAKSAPKAQMHEAKLEYICEKGWAQSANFKHRA